MCRQNTRAHQNSAPYHRSWLCASRTIFFCIALQYQNECRIEQNVWKTNKVKDIANVGLSVETAKVVLSNCSCQQLIISFKLSNVANLRIIYTHIYIYINASKCFEACFSRVSLPWAKKNTKLSQDSGWH